MFGRCRSAAQHSAAVKSGGGPSDAAPGTSSSRNELQDLVHDCQASLARGAHISQCFFDLQPLIHGWCRTQTTSLPRSRFTQDQTHQHAIFCHTVHPLACSKITSPPRKRSSITVIHKYKRVLRKAGVEPASLSTASCLPATHAVRRTFGLLLMVSFLWQRLNR